MSNDTNDQTNDNPLLDAVLPEDDDAGVVEAEIVEAPFDAETVAAELGIELPADPDAATSLLLRELMEARQEAGEYLGILQRVSADFDNFRKRVERDQAENVLRASSRIIEAMLPALDSFDAALAYEAQTPAEEKLLEGMRGTHSQLLDTLAREGLAPVGVAGEPFDPAVHEAVAGGGDGDLVVGQVLRRGYTLRHRVLRPALVTVETSPQEDTDSQD